MAEITLSDPGSYTISYERQAAGTWAIGTETGGQPLEDMPSGTMKLTPETSGTAIDLRAPSVTATYTIGSTEGQVIAQFRGGPTG